MISKAVPGRAMDLIHIAGVANIYDVLTKPPTGSTDAGLGNPVLL